MITDTKTVMIASSSGKVEERAVFSSIVTTQKVIFHSESKEKWNLKENSRVGTQDHTTPIPINPYGSLEEEENKSCKEEVFLHSLQYSLRRSEMKQWQKS